MANAGRVAIVPKGEYSATVAYKRLDLVRYNNDLYIAKKANTGVTPTDSETWMLSLENVSQTQYDNLINGTTAVGNALKLNGLTAEEFVSNENLLINPELEIGAVTITDKSGGTTTVASKWHISAHSGITYSAELTDDGLKITAQNGADGACLNLTQVNTDIVLEDGTYTLSFYCDKPENIRQCGFGSGNQTIVSGNSYGFEIDGNVVSNTFTISNNTGVHTFIQLLNEACDITIKWVKLELGVIATPPTPPNKEVEKLKCGVVDAKTANSVTLYKEFTEIDSTFTQDTAITDVVAKMAPDSKLCVTIYASTTGIYPSGNGVLEIDKHNVNGNFTAVKFTDRNNGKFYTAVVQLDTFVGWVNSADGGNADTVDGKHASEFQNKNDRREITSLIDSVTTPTDIRALMWQFPSGHYTWASSFNRNVIMPFVNDTGMHVNWERKQQDDNNMHYGILTIKSMVDNSQWATCSVFNNTSYTEWQSFLPLDGSVPMSGTLRARISGTVPLQLESIDNSAVAIAFYGGDASLGSLGFANDKATVWNAQGQHDILHTGNSQKVVTSASAPSDTSAVWVDSANKVSKIYIDGAWTALA